jgi:hypothetical protein
MENEFRDPVAILRRALDYLVVTRGERQAKQSDAFRLISERKDTFEKCCIDELLGDKARAMGARCECWRHPGNFEADMKARRMRVTTTGIKKDRDLEKDLEPPRKTNGKAAASGERNE